MQSISYIGFARSMSDTLWREASVRGFVAELIISTVADVGTFDVDTVLEFNENLILSFFP